MTRKDFLLALPGAAAAGRSAAGEPVRPKLLIVVAHPDDEYAFAATTYRLTGELGWAADLVVITNGEAGYRYSALAESVYGVALTQEREGRSRLPAIRRRMLGRAAKAWMGDRARQVPEVADAVRVHLRRVLEPHLVVVVEVRGSADALADSIPSLRPSTIGSAFSLRRPSRSAACPPQKNKIPRIWPKPEGICGMIAMPCLLPASSFS